MRSPKKEKIARTPQAPSPNLRTSPSLDWTGAAGARGPRPALSGTNGRDFDASDWWFRCSLLAPRPKWTASDRRCFELDGMATIAQVFLNGQLLVGV